ncbi:unnamed protein product [Leptidea sinapis]|nr:unnamed protein product [Leptidea sinapis]
MGFKSVVQSSAQGEQRGSNVNIMEYLRRIVPRMFQNTLSLLSRQIIQQFLDELVWRERFGISPGQAFDNIVLHIAEQSKLESRDSVTMRLNKIAANPFKCWKYPKKKDRSSAEVPPATEETGRGKRSRKRREISPPPPPPPATTKRRRREKTTYIKQEKVKEGGERGERGGRRKVARTALDEDDVELDLTVSLERHYFGQTAAPPPPRAVAIAVQCPLCEEVFHRSLELSLHVAAHVFSGEGEGAGLAAPMCRYCYQRFESSEQLASHLSLQHPLDTKSPELFTYACLICEVRFAAVLTLGTHMQRAHAPRELPYACPACPYRASAHRAAVDHVRSNALVFAQHARLHRSALEMRCPRCVLKFVHLGQLKEHQIRDHNSMDDVLPLCAEEHLITRPKNKARPPVKDSACHSLGETFERVTLRLRDALLCRECDEPLDADRHFLGVTRCSKCPFVTSCYRGMLQHSGYCAGPHSLEDAPRRAPAPLYCVCGYCSDIGTDMLTHLLLTHHTTAYASEEDAQANIVTETSPPSKPEEPVAGPETKDQGAEHHEEREGASLESAPDTDGAGGVPEYAPPSVISTQLSLDDLAPPSVLQQDQHDQELLKEAYDEPLATPRHEEQHYSLGDFEPLPQEPPPQPDFEQL